MDNRPFIDHVMKNGGYKNRMQMAKDFGVGHQTIGNFYTNKRHVSYEFIVKAQRHLGMSIFEIEQLLDLDNREKDVEFVNHKLLDTLIKRNKLKNDCELANRLDASPGTISKLRHGKAMLGQSMLWRISEVFDMKISEIRKLLGE